MTLLRWLQACISTYCKPGNLSVEKYSSAYLPQIKKTNGLYKREEAFLAKQMSSFHRILSKNDSASGNSRMKSSSRLQECNYCSSGQQPWSLDGSLSVTGYGSADLNYVWGMCLQDTGVRVCVNSGRYETFSWRSNHYGFRCLF